MNVIKDTQDGKFKGCDVYIGGLENKGVGIADYHDLESQVPKDLQKEVDDLREDIVKGKITDTGCVSYPQHCPGGLYP